ncbi:MAG: Inositol-1-monophosphatase [Candidatus Heimdallarchaeota archaeon LC_2]|nr:MAG: Inositol-1-monophosphatase [Candidatus Heimdallarchaeota archaeon LC_2]
MWLNESFIETDLKINKAMIRAKREITERVTQNMRSKSTINAAGQTSIDADLISEKIFLNTLINEKLHGVLYSEESGVLEFGHPSENKENSIVLMLDPLDGSQNYVKGLPIGCMSVGYGSYKDNATLGDLSSAMVMNLYKDEVLFGKLGDGSYYNGNRIQKTEISLTNKINPLIISYYFYTKRINQNNGFTRHYSTRSLGSSAWELALVALGKSDAYIDIRGVLKAHDFCAVKLILEELGGKFTFVVPPKYKQAEKIPLNDFKTGYSIVASSDPQLTDHLAKEIQENVLR